MQENLFETGPDCERCGAHCKVAETRNPEAKMLRHSNTGLCINCAVHDWLRNTYPPNILIAQSGPEILRYPMIQEKFADIMRCGLSDATPDEIDWERVVENWDLPFPTKLKTSGMNPCSQKELDEIAAGKRPGLGAVREDSPLAKNRGVIKSFEELNELEPGLGDSLKKCLDKMSP